MKNNIFKKNKFEFLINEEYSNGWYQRSFESWEPYTFDILESFSDKNKIYIDIGAWIGPTVLYGKNIYKEVFAFEPDRVALKRLFENLKDNHSENVTIIRKALSDSNSVAKISNPNNGFGNSQSSLLDIGKTKDSFQEIETISFKRFIDAYNIDISNIGLIKMDVEGYEKVLVPEILKHAEGVPMYLSLHWNILSKKDIEKILNLIFSKYKNISFEGRGLSVGYIVDNKRSNIVCS